MCEKRDGERIESADVNFADCKFNGPMSLLTYVIFYYIKRQFQIC
jgi:hypothetical protein